MDHRYSAIDCDEANEPNQEDWEEFARYCWEMDQRDEERFEEANMELLAVGG